MTVHLSNNLFFKGDEGIKVMIISPPNFIFLRNKCSKFITYINHLGFNKKLSCNILNTTTS